MSKTHAKDYLIEYISSTDKEWLKCLISETINTNGNISDDRLTEIYLNLTENKLLNIPNIGQNRIESNESIRLHSLTHLSGVNALASNQTIKFSENITILYGLNGAGKSSYFRILNEIVGGNQEKTIIPNIYDNSKKIDVELIYKKTSCSNNETIKWDGMSRALQYVNSCSVFDNSYLNGFLQPRTINEALLQPLGLWMFSYVATKIDEFKNRLDKTIQEYKSSKPLIDDSDFSDDFKKVLSTNISQEREYIESCFLYNEEDNAKLLEIREKLKDLKQVNIADKINLINKTIQSYTQNINKIASICEITTTNFIDNVYSIIQNYYEKKELNDKAKNQFQLFDSIPNSNSKEWKLFIESGHKYHPYISTTCPYCRQALMTEESKELLKAYSTFLTDKTGDELNSAELGLKNKIEQIKIIDTQILNEDIEDFIKDKYIETVPMQQYIQEQCRFLVEMKNALIQKLQLTLPIDKDIKIPDFKPLVELLNIECKKLNDKLSLLNSNPEKRAEEIKKLEIQERKLLERFAIYNHCDSLKRLLELNDKEQNLQKIRNGLSTTEITRLSNTANEELLTEKLKTNFIKELKALEKNNLQVDLVKTKSVKGKQNTKLILTNDYDIQKILSEGEQKAIGLALFLAEIKSMNSYNPIILDDPVNSLDHQIAGTFANRLLELENQIIIFNHNALFLNAFECSKEHHICKSGNSACNNLKGKHIKIYLLQDEGQSQKGVICDYKQNNAKNHILEAQGLLDKTPFNEHSKVALLIRRAVEGCIDEVIFKNQCPTKYSTKNSRINWDTLKKMVTDSDIIDNLHKIHDRVSGGEIHNGQEVNENRIRIEELRQFVTDIENILAGR